MISRLKRQENEDTSFQKFTNLITLQKTFNQIKKLTYVLR